MRVTRLPHLARETRRRHDRFLIILFVHRLPVPLPPTITAMSVTVPRRGGRRSGTQLRRGDAAAFNLQLARLALFLRRQDPLGSRDAVAVVVVVVVVFVDVGL